MNKGRMGFQNFVKGVAARQDFITNNLCLDILNNKYAGTIDENTKQEFKATLQQLHKLGYYLVGKDGVCIASNKKVETLERHKKEIDTMVNSIFIAQ